MISISSRPRVITIDNSTASVGWRVLRDVNKLDGRIEKKIRFRVQFALIKLKLDSSLPLQLLVLTDNKRKSSEV